MMRRLFYARMKRRPSVLDALEVDTDAITGDGPEPVVGKGDVFRVLAIAVDHGRVAEALLYLSDSVYHADEFDMDLSRAELAEFTGMSKESVSRIFKEFKEDGMIIIQGKKVTINNKDRLNRIYQLC